MTLTFNLTHPDASKALEETKIKLIHRAGSGGKYRTGRLELRKITKNKCNMYSALVEGSQSETHLYAACEDKMSIFISTSLFVHQGGFVHSAGSLV